MKFADGAEPEQTLAASINPESEVHVKQHNIDGLLSHGLCNVVGTRYCQYLSEGFLQQVSHRRQNSGVVINYQYGSVLVQWSCILIILIITVPASSSSSSMRDGGI